MFFFFFFFWGGGGGVGRVLRLRICRIVFPGRGWPKSIVAFVPARGGVVMILTWTLGFKVSGLGDFWV